MRRLAKPLALVFLVAMTIGCDRVTKHVATTTLSGGAGRSFVAGTVRLQYAENTGGFLSLGADWPPAIRTGLFTIGTGVLLVAAVAIAVRQRWTGWSLTALSLVLAGGASNWIDRVTRGSVVDFMNVGVGPWRTGVFNVADMAVMLGLAILVVVQYRRAPLET